MSSRSIPRRLFDLSLPIIGLNVLTVLALAIDTAMCGRLPNATAALTGLSFATQIVFLLMVAMLGLTIGATALVARAYGARDADRVEHVLTQSTQLTVLLALGVGALGIALAGPLMSLLGATGEAHAQGVAFLLPLLGGTVFWYLTLLYAAVLRGVGNTRLPFLVALGAVVLNVAFNYVFILGNFGMPALGVVGAALGTVVSHVASVIALITLLKRGAVPGLRVRLRPTKLDLGLARELYRIGAPAALDFVVLNVGFFAILGMLGRMADAAVAAHGIGLRVQSLAFVPGISISQATSALVGQALGAGSEAQARQVTRASVGLCMAIMSALAIALVAGVDPLLAVFHVEPGTDLARYTVEWIQLLGVTIPAMGIHVALVGTLRGAGMSTPSLLITTVTTVVQIPLSAVLGFTLGWGPFGVWLAFPLVSLMRAGLAFYAYRVVRWAKLGVHA